MCFYKHNLPGFLNVNNLGCVLLPSCSPVPCYFFLLHRTSHIPGWLTAILSYLIHTITAES